MKYSLYFNGTFITSRIVGNSNSECYPVTAWDRFVRKFVPEDIFCASLNIARNAKGESDRIVVSRENNLWELICGDEPSIINRFHKMKFHDGVYFEMPQEDDHRLDGWVGWYDDKCIPDWIKFLREKENPLQG